MSHIPRTLCRCSKWTALRPAAAPAASLRTASSKAPVRHPTRHLSSSNSHQHQHQHQHHKQARAFPSFLIASVVLGSAVYYAVSPPRKSSTLNGETFIPYTITARDVISPTSVVFTIAPHQHDPALPYLQPNRSPMWRNPLWSVEFKQPEVQIARHYTPLPPLDGADPRDGVLRFYVRAVGGGEMSNYLSRLAVGRDVYLRGPHTGFNVLDKLGARRRVVFLAGGTGLVPGMQVAKAVLDSSNDTSVSLLWAVRKREEVQSKVVSGTAAQSWWKFWASPQPTELAADMEAPSPIAKQLGQMKRKYGDRLDIRVAVDEEQTQFTQKDIQRALMAQRASNSPSSISRGCQAHDQRLQEHASEFQGPNTEPCKCQASDGQPGKNLFMVSGPDGFIAHYAGDKVWLRGTLTQGAVGGVAASLQKQNPALANDWLVLKL